MPNALNPQTNQFEYTTNDEDFRVLTADTAIASNATVVAVPTLAFGLGRFQRAQFRATLHFTTNSTAGFRYRLAVPASVTLYRARRATIAPDALTTLVTAYDVANNGTTDITITAASGTEGFVGVEGIIHNGANAGDFLVSFAQNVSNAGATTLRAGSCLEVKYI